MQVGRSMKYLDLLDRSALLGHVGEFKVKNTFILVTKQSVFICLSGWPLLWFNDESKLNVFNILKLCTFWTTKVSERLFSSSSNRSIETVV